MVSLADLPADERTARMALSMIVKPGDRSTGRVLAAMGAVATLQLLHETDLAVPCLRRSEWQLWRDRVGPIDRDGQLLERLEQAQESSIAVVIPGDRSWPAALDVLRQQAPYALWTRGATSLLSPSPHQRVTITGSRASTAYGAEVARDLAADMVQNECVVVAGGSFGIESAAHRAALALDGSTVAVLASGVDRLQPAAHAELLNAIANRGLLVSEQPPGATPSRSTLIARGRIMAALSDATIVVEAAQRSNALYMAYQARSLGRQVGAVPGPISSAVSAGPHQLIGDGHAHIVTKGTDVMKLLHGAQRRAREAEHEPLVTVYNRWADSTDRSL